MKRLISILAFFLILITAAVADTNLKKDGFVYTIKSDSTVEIIAYIGNSDDVTIPKTIEGRQVTSVKGNPFCYYPSDYGLRSSSVFEFVCRDCTVHVAQDHPSLATINGVLFSKTERKLIYYPAHLSETEYQIPEGINVIGEKAFINNTALRSVYIPSSVYRIENGAFSGSSITKVNIPSSVIYWNSESEYYSLGGGAFSNCSELRDVSFQDGLSVVGRSAFSGCKSLEHVKLPESIYRLDENAFYDCSNLEEINLPESINSIGARAFEGTALRNVTIPSGITSIQAETFGKCTALKNVVLPDTLTEIEYGAFEYCPSLKEINIPFGVTEIGGYAFCNTGLESITLPDTVQKLGGNAFSDCSDLTSVNTTSNLLEIGNYAFSNCPKLTVHGDRNSFAEGYCLYNDINFTVYGEADISYQDADTSWLGGGTSQKTTDNSPASLFYIEDSIVNFGHYEKDNNFANGAEPITWKVLKVDREAGQALLMSEYGLDSIPFQPDKTKVRWSESAMRDWLNNEFYNQAFDTDEQKAICRQYIFTSYEDCEIVYSTVWYDLSEDNVYLLSYAEAAAYFKKAADRVAKPTPYAIARGAYTSKGNCYWWLRTPGYRDLSFSVVDGDGKFTGSFQNGESDAVRPVILVDIQKLS